MDTQESRQKSKTGKKRKVRKRSKRDIRSKFRGFTEKANLVPLILAIILAYIVGKIILRYVG